MAEPDRNGISARLWRLPRQLLLALVNATAILVIVAAIFALAWRRLEPVAHSARAITLAHRVPLINTTPHGATRMAVHATVDTTRSHAGAPVRDGLRLINA